MKKKRNKIKSKLILLFCFIYFTSIGQNELKLDTLTLSGWNDFFCTNYNVKVEGSLGLECIDKDMFPTFWIYDSTLNCSECKYLFKKINLNSSIMVMSNGGELGTYLFYFEKNERNKSWIQKNYVSDSIKLYQINNELYYFKLFKNDELTNQKNERIVFFDTKGRIATQIIDFHTSNYKIKLECMKKGKIIISSSIDSDLYFNFKKMRFSKYGNKSNQFYFQKTFSSRINIKYN